MTNSLPFVYDTTDHYLCNDKAFISSGKNLTYLVSILNSSLFRFCFKDNFPELLGDSFEVRKTFFEKIPIKPPVPSDEWLFGRLASYIITAKKVKDLSSMALFFQQLVNGLVYELYFEKELRAAGIEFLPLLTREVIVPLPDEKLEQPEVIERVYRTLHDSSHPVRVGLFKLDTVWEVRIIEGKDK